MLSKLLIMLERTPAVQILRGFWKKQISREKKAMRSAAVGIRGS
jgi:hypothetical protein